MLIKTLLSALLLSSLLVQAHIISPNVHDVWTNDSLELTCPASENTTVTKWGTFQETGVFSYLTFLSDGECNTTGLLADMRYFDTRCYKNGNFKVKIKRMNISNHGQEWYCIHEFNKSIIANITVRVPTKEVVLKHVLGGVLSTIEKITTTLTCETSAGRPVANITWTKISKEEKETDITHDQAYNVSTKETPTRTDMTIVSSSIEIEPVREDNGTRIVCEATNRKAHTVGQEVTIYVQYPPTSPIFVVNNRQVNGTLRIISGKNVSIVCKSESYPLPTYCWNSIRGYDYCDECLNIPNIDRNDTWQCKATNDMTLPNRTTVSGNNTSNIKIHVLFPPTKPDLYFETRNESLNETVYAIRNDNVTIICRSDGDPIPIYQWSGQSTGPKLHIESISENTTKTCTASNNMHETLGAVQGSSSNTSIAVVVTYPPEKPYLHYSGHNATFLTNKATVVENSSFNVTCKADGYPPPQCTWEAHNFSKSPNLTFIDVSKETIGTYRCIAENKIKRSFPANEYMKNTYTELEVDVLYGSRIVMFYANGTEKKTDVFEVTAGETIAYNCSVDSNPESLIALSFLGQEIAHVVATQTLIHTRQITSCLDDGVYKCAAHNLYNNENATKDLTLQVICKPLISPDFDLQTNVSSARNHTVTFELEVIAKPIPKFLWSKLSGSKWNKLETDNKYKINTTYLHSDLTLKIITEDDFGSYKLSVQNEIGTSHYFFFLKANEKPDPPKMFGYLPEYVTETSAIIRWIPGFNGGPEQSFVLRYKLNSKCEWENVSIPDYGGKRINYTLDDLESSSVYLAELFAVNSEGNSVSVYLTFRTKDLPHKSIKEWKYALYICGGTSLLVLSLVGTYISRKRLKGQLQESDISQNVSSVSETLRETYHVRHELLSGIAAVNEEFEMTVKPLLHNSLHNQQELDDPISEVTEYHNTKEILKKIGSIKVSELQAYVKNEPDQSFSLDFQKIPTTLQMSCSFARYSQNIHLNRYKDILPYDHSRVRIDSQPDFFINASYIDGYDRPKAYIACLGPTARTHADFKLFWKMVWFERSEIVVMLTNLNEPSGMKCEQYWPDSSQDNIYGDIHVSCHKKEMFAEYTLRNFVLTRKTNMGTFRRCLTHLHYTAWPDKKTPEDVSSLLEFRQKFKDVDTTMNGPVIVHCSAGIGRTGAFIAIDRLIMEGQIEGSVNVVACITKMREQRVRMVQTCEQYKFVFKALAYALNIDFDPIPNASMEENINEISFDRRCNELEWSQEAESKDQMAARVRNNSYEDMNRSGADIPENTNRVYLYLNRSYEQSDYINAVYINSYIRKDHFIVAQSPLPGTESDFHTLIYQEDCFCVVSMEDFTEQGMKISQYLPEEIQPLEVGDFTLSSFIYDVTPQYTLRKVTIVNKEKLSMGEREFYHFQYNKWKAEYDTPESAEDFVKFVHDVKEYEKLGEDGSHVLVHCLKANERSGIFCAIAIMIEKLLIDEQVSVMNILMHLRTRRRTAITSKEQVKFCYKAALAIARMHGNGTSNVSGTDRTQVELV